MSEEKKQKLKEYEKKKYHKCLKKRNKKLKEYQKNIERQKSLNIIMNKIVF